MTIVGRVINGLVNRGIRRSLQGFISVFEDYWFDLKYNVETMKWIELEDLKFQNNNKMRGLRYQPMRVRYFRKLMSIMEIPENSVFVDFGSGKGRNLLLATRYNFKKVVGIEFSPELCEESRKIYKSFVQKNKSDVEVFIIEKDAASYAVDNDENVFFMFNPFDEIIVSKVVDNIIKSLEKKERKVWIIYANPRYHNILQRHFFQIKEYVYGGVEFIIYTNT